MKFEKCAEVTPGYFQCDNYLRPVFTLTNVQFVNRTFAVMSLLLMAGVLILMLIGMGKVSIRFLGCYIDVVQTKFDHRHKRSSTSIYPIVLKPNKECSRCLLKDEYAYRKVIIMKGQDCTHLAQKCAEKYLIFW